MPKMQPPYDFVFDFLPQDRIEVKKMFGHQCLYFDGLMVMFMICKKGNSDNGICIATSAEHIPSLSNQLKSLRHLKAYGKGSTGWRLLPSSASTFESDAVKTCELILKGDRRIGREPKLRKKL